MEPLRLPDGTRLDVRRVKPEDKRYLQEGFELLGRESRYRRFFAPTSELSSRQWAYLTEIDNRKHAALIVGDDNGTERVAVARCVADEDEPTTAEIAITITDSWQGRGVGSQLLRRLATVARDNGIERFSATMLGENRTMQRLMSSIGPIRSKRTVGNTVEMVVDLERDHGPGDGRPSSG